MRISGKLEIINLKNQVHPNLNTKTMSLKVIIANNQLALQLKDGRKVVDACIFETDRNLSDLLLINIDELLRKNKLTPLDIDRYTLRSDIAENYTTYRIAKAVVNALGSMANIAKNHSG